MKILNLFSGIGGNRADWPSTWNVHAVDNCSSSLDVYESLFPADVVIQGDAYEFLLENYDQYDFIWASPPCTSHSRFRLAKKPEFADLRLYALVIFLQTWCKDVFWCVENVDSYYPDLVPAIKRGRHKLWTNFYVPEFNVPEIDLPNASLEHLKAYHGYEFKVCQDRKLLRNMCHRKIGKEVLLSAYKIYETSGEYERVNQFDWLRSDVRDESQVWNGR